MPILQLMHYYLPGSEVDADVVYPHPTRPPQTQPIEIEPLAQGPSHEDIARLGDGEGDGEAPVLAGRYRLLRRLGCGGMGAVYLAEQLDTDRRVAVKILDASSRDWCRAIDRFLWEARLAARLRHPNVVEAYDFGSTPRGIVYMAMELLEGRDLRAVVRGGGLSWRWTRYVMRQICAGLNALHRIGVVHRDLKSSNCFYVERASVVKIIDFGIASFENDPRLRIEARNHSIIGTPEYMAPEQIRGEAVDRRCDVYAAGILIYELLTGHTPFCGRTAEEVFRSQLERPPPAIGSTAAGLPIPAGVDALLARALAKRAEDRFQTMGQLAEALEQLGEPDARGWTPSPTELEEPNSPGFDEAPTLRRLVDFSR